MGTPTNLLAETNASVGDIDGSSLRIREIKSVSASDFLKNLCDIVKDQEKRVRPPEQNKGDSKIKYADAKKGGIPKLDMLMPAIKQDYTDQFFGED